MKTVDELIKEFQAQAKIINEQLSILWNEDHETFQTSSYRLYDAICEMCELRDQLFPHQDRIKKDAELKTERDWDDKSPS